MSKVTVTLNLSTKQLEALKRFAAKTYDPKLGIDWKDVARGWAGTAFDEFMQKHMERAGREGE